MSQSLCFQGILLTEANNYQFLEDGSQSLCFQGILLTGIKITDYSLSTVSIPLFSGHFADGKDARTPISPKDVSIPLFSGHFADVSIVGRSNDNLRLNPFVFRAFC